MHCLFFILAAGVQFVIVFGDAAFATKPNDMLQSLKKNVSECMQQVNANMTEVEYFFRKFPQRTKAGKCFVACILEKHGVIKNERVDEERVMQISKENYHDNKTVEEGLKVALQECSGVDEEFELCEYVSKWNDCVHQNMGLIPDARRYSEPSQPSNAAKLDTDQRIFSRISQL